jgi:nicotinate-nucleotide adenylyltransferase
MNIALFGGTFDPIHRAHLAIAREAADRFHLDRVLFVPAAHPPWKDSGTPYADRLRMVELASATDPRLEASRLEEGVGKSYSIDTVERAQRLYPEARIYFIIGTDAFADVEKWHRADDLLRAVEFIVVARPGHVFTSPQGARVHRIDALALDVSSSAIRRELAKGGDTADLTPTVAAYIRRHHLYNVS